MGLLIAPTENLAAPTAEKHSTQFQQSLADQSALAVDWLVRSIEACGGQGSATYYSRFYRPGRGWAPPYPETTGYIIPTLLRSAAFFQRSQLIDLAVQQADWIVNLQFPDGALPGGWVQANRPLVRSIFNTGQMISGLVAVADQTQRTKYLDAAQKAARWLAREVDPRENMWLKHAYIKSYSPAYYSRVCWPMLEVCHRRPDQEIQTAAVQVLDTIASWQLTNGAFRNWAFRADASAYTHTIAYTIRGLWESGQLLGTAGDRFSKTALRSADVLRRKLESRGRLAGSYDEQLRGIFWFTCLTGNCQLALIWMRIYEVTRDARFFSAALKALQFVMARQRRRSLDPNVRGAIAGSSPFFGRYLTLRYPNWAAKFFVDACLSAHRHLQVLLEHGLCALP
ncbi:MAG TPA: hypothetical protein VGJ04_05520 [Pirellulales bacterium]